MALRKIREYGDPILTKPCRPVEKMNGRLMDLLEDMVETMYEANGVGLAAPQVGVLRRIAVVDIGGAEEELPSGEKIVHDEEDSLYVLINPVVLETSGTQTGQEGCLSLPGKGGNVTRPMHVKVKALDENLKEYEIEGEGLLARALMHEIDHLEGHFYTELVEGQLFDVNYDEED